MSNVPGIASIGIEYMWKPKLTFKWKPQALNITVGLGREGHSVVTIKGNLDLIWTDKKLIVNFINVW